MRRRPSTMPTARWPKRKPPPAPTSPDRKSTRLNSSHLGISYAVFCLKKKNKNHQRTTSTDFHSTHTALSNTSLQPDTQPMSKTNKLSSHLTIPLTYTHPSQPKHMANC